MILIKSFEFIKSLEPQTTDQFPVCLFSSVTLFSSGLLFCLFFFPLETYPYLGYTTVRNLLNAQITTKYILKHTSGVPLSTVLPDASPEAINLLGKFLKYSPEQRISASDVRHRLSPFLSFHLSLQLHSIYSFLYIVDTGIKRCIFFMSSCPVHHSHYVHFSHLSKSHQRIRSLLLIFQLNFHFMIHQKQHLSSLVQISIKS